MSSQVDNPTITGSSGTHEEQHAARWMILALAWLALVITFVDRLAWANVAPTVSSALAMPLSALGVFATAFFSGYVIANLVGGLVTDRFGPRVALVMALVPLGIFTFIFSFTGSVAFGLGAQFLMGLAAGADYAACIKLIASWFPITKRAKAIGLLMTSVPVGVLLANAIIPTLLLHVQWPMVYRGLGLATLAFAFVLIAVLSDGPTGRAKALPAQAGSIKALLHDRDLLCLALAGFGAAWGTWGFAFWANALMSKGHGLTAVQAGFVTTLFGAAAIVAKPATGALSDFLGGRRKSLILIVLAIYAAGLLSFGALETAFEFRIGALVLGFFGFSWGPLMAALIAEVAGRKSAGTATGFTNALWQMGGVLVPVVIGVVFQSTHSFYCAFAVMAMGPLLAFFAMLFVQEKKNF
ncbi:MFS transporter [Caballeronia sp. dw_19]|uniref:MFS transporter n=1 Tax=Caballeronia sp. dw_19 TaxID=2719791 RepID=UPI001BD6A98D|nr:MFS transporter [Caballeronia sp. dw_19]